MRMCFAVVDLAMVVLQLLSLSTEELGLKEQFEVKVEAMQALKAPAKMDQVSVALLITEEIYQYLTQQLQQFKSRIHLKIVKIKQVSRAVKLAFHQSFKVEHLLVKLEIMSMFMI